MAGNIESGRGRHPARWRTAAWSAAGLILLLPLVAMGISDEVNWGPGDFLIFGAMLIGACGVCELAARKTGNAAYQAAVGVAAAAAFVLIWMNLAVGIIGDEGEPANLMFGGVLAIGGIAAAIARFRPEGMARAMVATAMAQALVGAIALSAGHGKTVVLTAFFVTLWLVSAGLFRKAARRNERLEA